MEITFYKYQGTGNDFILIDDRELKFPTDDTELVANLCNRKFGIGADGLILLQPHQSESYFMKYYNSDGRESSMCGNGGRCLAAFAFQQKVVTTNHTFMAIDGPHQVEAELTATSELWVKLKMQDVGNISIPENGTFVLNTGSPHYIKFIKEPLNSINLVDDAKQIRYNNSYKNEGINVNFINLLGLQNIAIRTYERGVEDETLSCGTGVTAAAISTVLYNNLPDGTHVINISTSGGNLSVALTFNKLTNIFTNVWLQGPAKFVFDGRINI